MKQSDKFKDLEFAQVIKGGKQVLLIEGKDLENQTKYGLQALIGEKLGDGIFSLRYKERGSNETKHINCRSIVTKKQDPGKQSPGQMLTGLDFFFGRFDDLDKKFETLKGKLDEKIEENYKLRLEILEKKNSEGIDLTEIITNIGSLLLNNRLKSIPGAPAALADQTNSPDGIPDEIKEVLQKIDWSKIKPADIKQLFEKYKTFIPLKEG